MLILVNLFKVFLFNDFGNIFIDLFFIKVIKLLIIFFVFIYWRLILLYWKIFFLVIDLNIVFFIFKYLIFGIILNFEIKDLILCFLYNCVLLLK